jgi:hypothetical protein
MRQENLTVKEIKQKFTNNDIQKIFDKAGMHIDTITKGRNKGMTVAFNKADQYFYLPNYVLAYHYFLKMNWLNK